MRGVTLALVVLALPALLMAQAAKDESKLKPSSRALEQRFKIVKERFDEGKRRYVWVLEARETSEDACQFDAIFQDVDDKDVTSVKLEFEDGGKRTDKGERYTAFVKYPIRKTMERVAQIVIKKSD